jgi:hypothetical protein
MPGESLHQDAPLGNGRASPVLPRPLSGEPRLAPAGVAHQGRAPHQEESASLGLMLPGRKPFGYAAS